MQRQTLAGFTAGEADILRRRWEKRKKLSLTGKKKVS